MWKVFMHPDYATMWTAVGAIATGLAAILGAIALIYTIVGFRQSLKMTHYTTLDTMYITLLQMTLERPYLKTPNCLADDLQISQYDTYAYLLWNFLESIHDHCLEDKQLQATWYPSIRAESRLHRAWLDLPENQIKFKASFYQFIRADQFEVA